MNFNYVTLKNFGPFKDQTFQFVHGRVNWLIGTNASGKSQLAGAMLAAIVGRPALDIHRGGLGPSSVELGIEEGGQTETVLLTVSDAGAGPVKVTKTAGPLSLSILAQLAEENGQQLVIGDNFKLDQPEDAQVLLGALPAAVRHHPEYDEVRRGFEGGGYIGSGSRRELMGLIVQCAARFRSETKLPLIVDAWGRWGDQSDSLGYALLEEVARIAQVIVLTPMSSAPEGRSSRIVESDRHARSLAASRTVYEQSLPKLRQLPGSKWVQGAIFRGHESRTCEFKEVKGANPLGSIKNAVDEYVVAFLNAENPREGAIFWGIRDADRAIVGVTLEPAERNSLVQVMVQKLLQIFPPVAPTQYRVSLHPVNDGRKELENLYVIEVRVPPVRRTFLFATGGGEVFIKTDAGKRKLNVHEVQRELASRLGFEPEA